MLYADSIFSVIHFDSHLGRHSAVLFLSTSLIVIRRRHMETPGSSKSPVRSILMRIRLQYHEYVQADGPWLPDEEIPVSHGSYFYYAAKEGLLAPNNANIVSRVHSRASSPFSVLRSMSVSEI